MFALVKIAGRQYRVSPGEQVKVDLLDAEPGGEWASSTVMMVADDQLVEIGSPEVPYIVKFEVLGHGRHKKVLSYRFVRRGGVRKTHGHRQHYTLLKVKSIEKGT